MLWNAPAAAQSGPQKGMVWAIPEGVARAEMDLHEMTQAGVEAVRTEVFTDRSLLRLADTLGLSLYLDLPVSRLPAGRLLDTLYYARSILDSALFLAREHPSIRAVGLTRHSDTSELAACRYLEELAGRLRATGPPDLQAYYVTSFLEDDVCGTSVDFVLADLRDANEPSVQLGAWPDSIASVGVAALGTWVRGDTLRGLNVASSPERQARYFERHLPALLSGAVARELPAVFVYRWRDRRGTRASAMHDPDQPLADRYGLHATDGSARPAMSVVAGIYTGRQTVFAFEPGTPLREGAPWPTLAGWGVLLALGIFYALSPRFRHMVPRYFQARFFFREAVREGRDVLLGASTVLLGSLGVASGLVAYVVAESLRTSRAFTLALGWLAPPMQDLITTLLARPLVLVVLVGCLQIIVLLAWAVVLSILSRRKHVVTPAQVLMLVVWPRWPFLIVMVGAIVVASLETPNPYLIGGLAASWILLSLAASVRTLIDLSAVARIPMWLLPLAVALHPGVLASAAFALLLVGYIPELEFLWHAAVRR